MAAARLRTFVEALLAWWGTAAPDVLSGEWVGLGRDQLRLREDGALAVVPTLTRRLGPDAFALPELAGVPLAWSRTAPMIVRLAAAVLFEWLAGLPFLDAQAGGAMAVHQRLALRLRHPPSLGGVEPSLARFDELLAQALRQPASLSPDDLLERVERLATSAPSSPG